MAGQNEDLVLLLPQNLGENFIFPKANPKLSQQIIVECVQVQHISSGWAAGWVRWHRSLDPRIQFVFRDCPRKFIDLINFVDGFLPAESTIQSFQAPYQCLECGFEETETMKRGLHFLENHQGEAAQVRIPFELNCAKCPGMMEFAVLENIYLRFLNPKHE